MKKTQRQPTQNQTNTEYYHPGANTVHIQKQINQTMCWLHKVLTENRVARGPSVLTS